MDARRSIPVLVVVAHGVLLSCAEPGESPRNHWTDVADSNEFRLIRDAEQLCEDCIALERVLVMGDTIGEGYLREAFHMVRDSAGNYWFGQYEAVKVFDPAGNFVGEVGRAGEGPLEWGNAMPVHTDALGRVHVFDTGNQRHTVAGPDFTLIEEEKLPGGREFRALGDGDRWVVNDWAPAPEQRHRPLHILEGEEIVTSFGGLLDDFPDDRMAQLESWRILTTDAADRIFSSPWYSQEIEVWSDDGRRITGFSNPAFNGPSFDRSQWQPDDPPPNTMRALRVDGEGRLWVLSWQRRDDWRDLMEERRGPDGRVRLEMKPGLATMDRMEGQIDVIDLTTATVIARTRMEGVAVDFLGDDALWTGDYVGAGHLRAGIWKIGFTP